MANSGNALTAMGGGRDVVVIENELSTAEGHLILVTEQILILDIQKEHLENTVTDLKMELARAKRGGRAPVKVEIEQHPWTSNMLTTMNEVLKISGFRTNEQQAAVNAVMDSRDVLLIAPAGTGKSLAYQLPGLLSSGVTIVVTPLISLMEDQARALQAYGVETAIINYLTSIPVVQSICHKLMDANSTLKMVFINPDILSRTGVFMSCIASLHQQGRLARVVVDEVHCVSQMSCDFKEDYRVLGTMKQNFPNAPLVGLTSTATDRIVADVYRTLNLQSSCCAIIRDTMDPINKVRLSVLTVSAKKKGDEIVKLVSTKFSGQAGMVFCQTVDQCNTLANNLRKAGVACGSYHGKMTPHDRSRILQQWMNNDFKVIITTTALGMGINKRDVRFVIHRSMPKSVENYYQETGRAGRDGLGAECILLYNFQDAILGVKIFNEGMGKDKLMEMLRFMTDQTTCRRQLLVPHLGYQLTENNEKCMNCDNCGIDMNPSSRMEVKINAEFVLKILKVLIGDQITAIQLVDVLGSGRHSELSLVAVDGTQVPAQRARNIWEVLLGRLFTDDYLMEISVSNFYRTLYYLKPKNNKLKALVNNLNNVLYTLYVPEEPKKQTKARQAKKEKENAECAAEAGGSQSTQGKKEKTTAKKVGKFNEGVRPVKQRNPKRKDVKLEVIEVLSETNEIAVEGKQEIVVDEEKPTATQEIQQQQQTVKQKKARGARVAVKVEKECEELTVSDVSSSDPGQGTKKRGAAVKIEEIAEDIVNSSHGAKKKRVAATKARAFISSLTQSENTSEATAESNTSSKVSKKQVARKPRQTRKKKQDNQSQPSSPSTKELTPSMHEMNTVPLSTEVQAQEQLISEMNTMVCNPSSADSETANKLEGSSDMNTDQENCSSAVKEPAMM